MVYAIKPNIMRKIFVLFALLFLLHNVAKAQSFTMINDTIHITATPGIHNYFDSLVINASPATFSWSIIASDFPADWQTPSVSAFCDDNVCRNMNVLWPTPATNDTTFPYAAHDTGVLKLALDLTPSSTSGCYYVTARLHNISSYADSATETWGICYTATTGTAIVSYNDNITTYPNPANDELHVQYDANMQISTAEVYSLMGRRLKTTPCANGEAYIKINDIAPGLYFIRLSDAVGVSHIVRFVKK